MDSQKKNKNKYINFIYSKLAVKRPTLRDWFHTTFKHLPALEDSQPHFIILPLYLIIYFYCQFKRWMFSITTTDFAFNTKKLVSLLKNQRKKRKKLPGTKNTSHSRWVDYVGTRLFTESINHSSIQFKTCKALNARQDGRNFKYQGMSIFTSMISQQLLKICMIKKVKRQRQKLIFSILINKIHSLVPSLKNSTKFL